MKLKRSKRPQGLVNRDACTALIQNAIVVALMLQFSLTSATALAVPQTDLPLSPEPQRTNAQSMLASELYLPSSWIERERAIKEILPKISPCVVAVAGGSGVVVNRDGLVFTVAHVTGQVGEIVSVGFSNGKTEQAKILRVNSQSDAATLQLLGDGPWPHMTVNSDRRPHIGDWCLALGYPSSFPRDAPAIVRLGRILAIDGNRIQTECALMGGDSGGPLVNLNGQIIGIHSQVKTRIDENFHLPIEKFLGNWNQRASGGNSTTSNLDNSSSVVLPSLGVRAETDGDFVRVRQVYPASPAALAGLQREDVIVLFDGVRIRKFDQILTRLTELRPGDRVDLIYNRAGKLVRKSITLK